MFHYFAALQAASFICMLSGVAYVIMGIDAGYYTRCTDGRPLFLVRYLDWLVSVPVMLVLLTGATQVSVPLDKVVRNAGLGVIMILAGLMAAMVEGQLIYLLHIMCSRITSTYSQQTSTIASAVYPKVVSPAGLV